MAEQYYESPRNLTVEGQNVEITFNRMTPKDQSDLRNFFQKYSLGEEGELEGIDLPSGGIEQLFIKRGLSGLKIGTREVRLNPSNPVESFPNDIGMGDDEDGIMLYTEVLKTGVDKNRWAAHRFPYQMVFAQYLGMVNDEKAEKEEAEYQAAQEEGRKAPEPDARPENGTGSDPLPAEDTSQPTALNGSDIVQTLAGAAN